MSYYQYFCFIFTLGYMINFIGNKSLLHASWDYRTGMGMAYMSNIPWIFFIQILALASNSEAKVSAVIVFGDSSVDSGNNNYIPTIAKCNFEPYGRDFPGGTPTGRFCNGRLPPDFISEGLGLKPVIPAYLDPALNISEFATGVCFASAATGYDNATADVLKVIPLWKEVEYYKEYQTKLRAYLGDKKANGIISNALYLISIGTNDFLENYYALPDRKSQFTVQQYEDFLIGIAENFVRQIYSLGARKMSLTGLPPMGCLPVQRATNLEDPLKCVEERNKIALEFNGKLKTLVAKLNKNLPGLKMFFADPYYPLLQLITTPSEYGFEVAEEGCCGTGLFEMGILCNRHNPFTCTDANKYVFWDAIHPSQRTNKIISDNLLRELKQLSL
ncbi:GDSL esterase/lipase At2g42990-like [Durio zibethinus]|uniref:GDSL esterase/lipase At2g42990-like n=1 Tax=Durio zibethinus TaxID=66656 RepID=A0A6P5XGN0_DURZI|nr:GDSL esterase/lipase At2g42990-like [Durio zibethinus]